MAGGRRRVLGIFLCVVFYLMPMVRFGASDSSDILEKIKINNKNPKELNEFLGTVLKYKDDFQWIRRNSRQFNNQPINQQSNENSHNKQRRHLIYGEDSDSSASASLSENERSRNSRRERLFNNVFPFAERKRYLRRKYRNRRNNRNKRELDDLFESHRTRNIEVIPRSDSGRLKTFRRFQNNAELKSDGEEKTRMQRYAPFVEPPTTSSKPDMSTSGPEFYHTGQKQILGIKNLDDEMIKFNVSVKKYTSENNLRKLKNNIIKGKEKKRSINVNIVDKEGAIKEYKTDKQSNSVVLTLKNNLDAEETPQEIAEVGEGNKRIFLQFENKDKSKRNVENQDKSRINVENQDKSKRNVENNDKSQSNVENKDKSRINVENQDKSKRNVENNDKSQRNVENKDKSRRNVENQDKSKRNVENNDKSQSNVENKDKSRINVENQDKSKRNVENNDKSQSNVENKDKSRINVENQDKSKRNVENNDKSQRNVENQDKSKRNTENKDKSQRNVENKDKCKRNVENTAFNKHLNVPKVGTRQRKFYLDPLVNYNINSNKDKKRNYHHHHQRINLKDAPLNSRRSKINEGTIKIEEIKNLERVNNNNDNLLVGLNENFEVNKRAGGAKTRSLSSRGHNRAENAEAKVFLQENKDNEKKRNLFGKNLQHDLLLEREEKRKIGNNNNNVDVDKKLKKQSFVNFPQNSPYLGEAKEFVEIGNGGKKLTKKNLFEKALKKASEAAACPRHGQQYLVNKFINQNKKDSSEAENEIGGDNLIIKKIYSSNKQQINGEFKPLNEEDDDEEGEELNLGKEKDELMEKNKLRELCPKTDELNEEEINKELCPKTGNKLCSKTDADELNEENTNELCPKHEELLLNDNKLQELCPKTVEINERENLNGDKLCPKTGELNEEIVNELCPKHEELNGNKLQELCPKTGELHAEENKHKENKLCPKTDDNELCPKHGELSDNKLQELCSKHEELIDSKLRDLCSSKNERDELNERKLIKQLKNKLCPKHEQDELEFDLTNVNNKLCPKHNEINLEEAQQEEEKLHENNKKLCPKHNEINFEKAQQEEEKLFENNKKLCPKHNEINFEEAQQEDEKLLENNKKLCPKHNEINFIEAQKEKELHQNNNKKLCPKHEELNLVKVKNEDEDEDEELCPRHVENLQNKKFYPKHEELINNQKFNFKHKQLLNVGENDNKKLCPTGHRKEEFNDEEVEVKEEKNEDKLCPKNRQLNEAGFLKKDESNEIYSKQENRDYQNSAKDDDDDNLDKKREDDDDDNDAEKEALMLKSRREELSTKNKQHFNYNNKKDNDKKLINKHSNTKINKLNRNKNNDEEQDDDDEGVNDEDNVLKLCPKTKKNVNIKFSKIISENGENNEGEFVFKRINANKRSSDGQESLNKQDQEQEQIQEYEREGQEIPLNNKAILSISKVAFFKINSPISDNNENDEEQEQKQKQKQQQKAKVKFKDGNMRKKSTGVKKKQALKKLPIYLANKAHLKNQNQNQSVKPQTKDNGNLKDAKKNVIAFIQQEQDGLLNKNNGNERFNSGLNNDGQLNSIRVNSNLKNKGEGGNLNQRMHNNLNNEANANLQNKEVNGNLKQEVNGNLKQDLNENLKQEVNGNLKQDLNENLRQEVDGNLKQDFKGNLKQDFNGNLRQEVNGNLKQGFNNNLNQQQQISNNLNQAASNKNLNKATNNNLNQAVNDNLNNAGNAELNSGLRNNAVKANSGFNEAINNGLNDKNNYDLNKATNGLNKATNNNFNKAKNNQINNAIKGKLNNAKNGELNNAKNGKLNNAINDGLNNAINGELNIAINDGLNNAISNGLNNAVNDALNNAIHDKINNARNDKLNNAINGKLNNAINGEINNAINGRSNEATNRKLNNAMNGRLNNKLQNTQNNGKLNKPTNNDYNKAANGKLNSARNDNLNNARNVELNNAINGKLNNAINSELNNAINGELNQPTNSELNEPTNSKLNQQTNSELTKAINYLNDAVNNELNKADNNGIYNVQNNGNDLNKAQNNGINNVANNGLKKATNNDLNKAQNNVANNRINNAKNNRLNNIANDGLNEAVNGGLNKDVNRLNNAANQQVNEQELNNEINGRIINNLNKAISNGLIDKIHNDLNKEVNDGLNSKRNNALIKENNDGLNQEINNKDANNEAFKENANAKNNNQNIQAENANNNNAQKITNNNKKLNAAKTKEELENALELDYPVFSDVGRETNAENTKILLQTQNNAAVNVNNKQIKENNNNINNNNNKNAEDALTSSSSLSSQKNNENNNAFDNNNNKNKNTDLSKIQRCSGKNKNSCRKVKKSKNAFKDKASIRDLKTVISNRNKKKKKKRDLGVNNNNNNNYYYNKRFVVVNGENDDENTNTNNCNSGNDDDKNNNNNSNKKKNKQVIGKVPGVLIETNVFKIQQVLAQTSIRPTMMDEDSSKSSGSNKEIKVNVMNQQNQGTQQQQNDETNGNENDSCKSGNGSENGSGSENDPNSSSQNQFDESGNASVNKAGEDVNCEPAGNTPLPPPNDGEGGGDGGGEGEGGGQGGREGGGGGGEGGGQGGREGVGEGGGQGGREGVGEGGGQGGREGGGEGSGKNAMQNSCCASDEANLPPKDSLVNDKINLPSKSLCESNDDDGNNNAPLKSNSLGCDKTPLKNQESQVNGICGEEVKTDCSDVDVNNNNKNTPKIQDSESCGSSDAVDDNKNADELCGPQSNNKNSEACGPENNITPKNKDSGSCGSNDGDDEDKNGLAFKNADGSCGPQSDNKNSAADSESCGRSEDSNVNNNNTPKIKDSESCGSSNDDNNKNSDSCGSDNDNNKNSDSCGSSDDDNNKNSNPCGSENSNAPLKDKNSDSSCESDSNVDVNNTPSDKDSGSQESCGSSDESNVADVNKTPLKNSDDKDDDSCDSDEDATTSSPSINLGGCGSLDDSNSNSNANSNELKDSSSESSTPPKNDDSIGCGVSDELNSPSSSNNQNSPSYPLNKDLSCGSSDSDLNTNLKNNLPPSSSSQNLDGCGDSQNSKTQNSSSSESSGCDDNSYKSFSSINLNISIHQNDSCGSSTTTTENCVSENNQQQDLNNNKASDNSCGNDVDLNVGGNLDNNLQAKDPCEPEPEPKKDPASSDNSCAPSSDDSSNKEGSENKDYSCIPQDSVKDPSSSSKNKESKITNIYVQRKDNNAVQILGKTDEIGGGEDPAAIIVPETGIMPQSLIPNDKRENEIYNPFARLDLEINQPKREEIIERALATNERIKQNKDNFRVGSSFIVPRKTKVKEQKEEEKNDEYVYDESNNDPVLFNFGNSNSNSNTKNNVNNENAVVNKLEDETSPTSGIEQRILGTIPYAPGGHTIAPGRFKVKESKDMIHGDEVLLKQVGDENGTNSFGHELSGGCGGNGERPQIDENEPENEKREKEDGLINFAKDDLEELNDPFAFGEESINKQDVDDDEKDEFKIGIGRKLKSVKIGRKLTGFIEGDDFLNENEKDEDDILFNTEKDNILEKYFVLLNDVDSNNSNNKKLVDDVKNGETETETKTKIRTKVKGFLSRKLHNFVVVNDEEMSNEDKGKNDVEDPVAIKQKILQNAQFILPNNKCLDEKPEEQKKGERDANLALNLARNLLWNNDEKAEEKESLPLKTLIRVKRIATDPIGELKNEDYHQDVLGESIKSEGEYGDDEEPAEGREITYSAKKLGKTTTSNNFFEAVEEDNDSTPESKGFKQHGMQEMPSNKKYQIDAPLSSQNSKNVDQDENEQEQEREEMLPKSVKLDHLRKSFKNLEKLIDSTAEKITESNSLIDSFNKNAKEETSDEEEEEKVQSKNYGENMQLVHGHGRLFKPKLHPPSNSNLNSNSKENESETYPTSKCSKPTFLINENTIMENGGVTEESTFTYLPDFVKREQAEEIGGGNVKMLNVKNAPIFNPSFAPFTSSYETYTTINLLETFTKSNLENINNNKDFTPTLNAYKESKNNILYNEDTKNYVNNNIESSTNYNNNDFPVLKQDNMKNLDDSGLFENEKINFLKSSEISEREKLAAVNKILDSSSLYKNAYVLGMKEKPSTAKSSRFEFLDNAMLSDRDKFAVVNKILENDDSSSYDGGDYSTKVFNLKVKSLLKAHEQASSLKPSATMKFGGDGGEFTTPIYNQQNNKNKQDKQETSVNIENNENGEDPILSDYVDDDNKKRNLNLNANEMKFASLHSVGKKRKKRENTYLNFNPNMLHYKLKRSSDELKPLSDSQIRGKMELWAMKKKRNNSPRNRLREVLNNVGTTLSSLSVEDSTSTTSYALSTSLNGNASSCACNHSSSAIAGGVNGTTSNTQSTTVASASSTWSCSSSTNIATIILPICPTTVKEKDELTDLNDMLCGRLMVKIIEDVQKRMEHCKELSNRFPEVMDRNSAACSVKSLDKFRKNEMKESAKASQHLLHKVIEALNRVVADQVHRRSCQKLAPELKYFLQQNTRFAKEVDKECNGCDGDSENQYLYSAGCKETAMKGVQIKELRRKIAIIRKLLKKYYKMSEHCQVSVEPIKVYLLDHLEMLKDMLKQITHPLKCKTNNNTTLDQLGCPTAPMFPPPSSKPEVIQKPDYGNNLFANDACKPASVEGEETTLVLTHRSTEPTTPFVEPQEAGCLRRDLSIKNNKQQAKEFFRTEAPERKKLVEKNLEVLGLGEKQKFYPQFDVNKLYQNSLDKIQSDFQFIPRNRQTRKATKKERPISLKYKKLIETADALRRKRETEEKLGKIFEKKLAKLHEEEEETNLPSSFETPLVLSLDQ